MSTIYLNRDELPLVLQRAVGGYKGKSFRLCKAATVTINSMWDGGSRSTYTAVDLVTGDWQALVTDTSGWPNVKLERYEIQPNTCVLERVMVLGKDMGYIIYLPEENFTKMLPSDRNELPLTEQVVLAYTCRFKNSYGGRSNIRLKEAHYDTGISGEDWDRAVDSLIGKKYLRKNKSVTPEGRNAIGDKRFHRGQVDLRPKEETSNV